MIDNNKENKEKQIDCVLEINIDPKNGRAQGNFLCSVDKDKDESWKNVNFDNISINISPNNDIISGIPSIDEISANPSKTDEEIKKIKEKRQNNENVNVLTNIVDYYSVKTEINTLTLIEIDINSCDSTGKLTFIGSSLNDIEENINFDLPLTYPNSELKCEIKKVKKYTNTSIKCYAQIEFKLVEQIIIESRLIKKKNQELFYIQGKTFNLADKKSCIKYNDFKNKLIQKRQNSGIYYALIGQLENVNKIIQFFMALTRKSENNNFNESYYFDTNLLFTNIENLRYLEELTIENSEVECKLDEGLELNYTGGYNCNSKTTNYEEIPQSLEIDTDKVDYISGIEKINTHFSSITNKVDYSNKNNLEKIDSLPEVTINNINGDTCSENGQYIISGNITESSNLKNKYSNIEIIFSSPVSSGLCEIEIYNINISIICQNKEKFDISQIIIDRSLIQDSEGNYIFILGSYSNPEQFSCDISFNSIITPESSYIPTNSTFDDGTDRTYSKNLRKIKGGLFGGAIAGIILASVVAVAALGIVIFLMKKGIVLKSQGYLEPTTIIGELKCESQVDIKNDNYN